MAVNGYAAAQDVADLKVSTAALAVAMGNRVNVTEAALVPIAEAVADLPEQFDAIDNELATKLIATENLADLSDAAAARANLGAVSTSALAASAGADLVGSIASGTGATARTLQAKLRDYVSIKDFGAVCDGVTDDTAAIHAAMNAHDNILVPGYTKANIVWPRQGVRLFGTGVGEFDPTLFTYQRGTLIEAFNPALPAITINPDTAGANLNHCVIENMCVAGVGRVGDGIAVVKTTGTYKVADLIINNVSTRSARYGLYVTAELLWASFDHLTHDFCLDGCRIVTTSFVNGLVAGVWAARRCYRHGFYWNKTDVSNSGFQAWDIGLLSADYNGDFNSTATAQAGVIGVYINGFEGLKIGQVVAEGNGMDQAAADGHGILIEGSVNRGIVLQSVAIESSPLPFRWKGDVASGHLGDFYRFSSSTGQVPGIITATCAMAADGTTSPPKITLGGNFAGEMRTTFDGATGGYPTNPGMDYIPAQGTTLHVAERTAITINCGVSSKTITALTRHVIGSTLTLWNYAASTSNTVTLDGTLMFDGVSRTIPANETGSFVVLGFPLALKLAPVAQNGFLQAGTGAVVRTGLAKMRDYISVKDFGAKGDGVTDDAPAFNAALAASVGGLAGRGVYVPGSNARYKIGSTLVVPGGARLYGDGARSSSFLIKAFNGTFMTIADGGQVHGLRMDGQGATYTGKGIEHIGGNQEVSDLFIYDTGDYTVYFTVTSGANCHYENVTAYVYGSVVGSGVTPGTLKWAFFIEDSASAPGGTPRHFINIKTAGKESFYFGASNNTLISASALYDLGWPVYSAGVREYSRNVTITGCRIASSANLNISGSGNIVGCDIGSKVSLKVSSVYCLGPNLYNNGWEDVSGTPNNLIYSIGDQTYTPVFAVDGTPVTLGSAPTPVGYWNRSGRKVTARVRILPAADTVFPVVAAKGITISLPLPTSALLLQAGVVHARISASSGTTYYCSGYVNAGASVAILERDTSGPVTQTSPGSLLAGSAIWATIEYDV